MTGFLVAQEKEMALDDMTFEDLLNIKVVSFDGTPREWKKTPAAIYVISKEAISKSAARSLPDLLRGVPGLHVAQINSNTWAIGSRGFTRRYSNKLLVLIDGRSIYTPLFSGVHWELNDIPLENIERIEIIRGPGGSLWGANAVNGVINIITKSAVETQGNYLKLGTGNTQDFFASYRFGDVIPENNLAYRFTFSGNKTGHGKSIDGRDAKDDWGQLRLSTRIDWEPDGQNKFLLSAGTYKQRTENEINIVTQTNAVIPLYEDNLDSYGHYILGRWENRLNLKNTFMAQFYYDIYNKEEVQRAEKIQTYDVELRNVYDYNNTHTFTLGAGYRIVRDDISNAAFLSYLPAQTQKDTLRIYGQDEIAILKNELTLILGLKYERNDHTGTEWQPSAKLIWTPTPVHTFWGSIARSVRTPSRSDEDLSNRIGFAGPNEIRVIGDRGLESERQLAYEVGYRFTPDNSSFSLDTTLFYNDYNHFYNSSFIGNNVVINDTSEGYSIGGEASASYAVNNTWKLRASYSYIETNISGNSVFAGGSPAHLASLLSETKISEKLSFFQNFYYTDYYQSSRHEYSDSLKLDLGFRWQIKKELSLSAWGTNLLDPQTSEYRDNQSPGVDIPRSFYIQLEWNF